VSVRLFVGNLDYSVNEAELRQHFGEVGAPAQVALPVDRETGRPRGFAFVEFTDRAVAEEVIRRFNGQALKGRPLAISEARAREDRPPMSGPRPPRPPFSGPPMGGPPRAPRGFDGPPGGGGGVGGPGRDSRR
jgi:RNA recognition motif-containing protein